MIFKKFNFILERYLSFDDFSIKANLIKQEILLKKDIKSYELSKDYLENLYDSWLKIPNKFRLLDSWLSCKIENKHYMDTTTWFGRLIDNANDLFRDNYAITYTVSVILIISVLGYFGKKYIDSVMKSYSSAEVKPEIIPSTFEVEAREELAVLRGFSELFNEAQKNNTTVFLLLEKIQALLLMGDGFNVTIEAPDRTKLISILSFFSKYFNSTNWEIAFTEDEIFAKMQKYKLEIDKIYSKYFDRFFAALKADPSLAPKGSVRVE